MTSASSKGPRKSQIDGGKAALLNTALTEGLIYENSRGGARVQRGDFAFHGYADEKITIFPNESADALALGAYDDANRAF